MSSYLYLHHLSPIPIVFILDNFWLWVASWIADIHDAAHHLKDDDAKASEKYIILVLTQGLLEEQSLQSISESH